MFRQIAAVSTVALALVAQPGRAAAENLILNGSFESGITSWSIGTGRCSWEALQEDEISNSRQRRAPAPTDGAAALFSDLNSSGACTFYQDIALPAGATVLVSADVGSYFDHGGGFGSPTGCSISFAVTTPAGAPIATVYRVDPTATAPLTPSGPVDISGSAGSTVRIVATTSACATGAQGILVDKVVVDATVAEPVPTLSEWALILFGALLAGGAALYIQRRRLTA